MDRIVRRMDALANGLAPHDIERRLRCGEWVRLQRGIYAPPPCSPLTRARAAVLAVPGAVVSHQTAARVHGIDVVHSLPGDDVTLPRAGRRADRAGDLRCHARALPAEDVVTVAGVPLTSPARTARDLLLDADRLTAIWATEQALRRGLLTRADLLDRLIGRQPHAPRARIRLAFADPLSESPLETAVRLVLRDHKLPPPALQVQVGPYRIDLGYDEARLGIECDGRATHDPLPAAYADRERANALLVAGWRLLRFTWRDVVVRPAYIAATVRTALEASNETRT